MLVGGDRRSVHRANEVSRAIILRQCVCREAVALLVLDSGSIVKTWALDALARIASGNPKLEEEAVDLLRGAERNGTSAMRARSRRLLRTLFHAINEQ